MSKKWVKTAIKSLQENRTRKMQDGGVVDPTTPKKPKPIEPFKKPIYKKGSMRERQQQKPFIFNYTDPTTNQTVNIKVTPNLNSPRIKDQLKLRQSLEYDASKLLNESNNPNSLKNLEKIRDKSDVRFHYSNDSFNYLENGGAASTGQAIGSLVGSAANMIVPGLGSILSPVLGMAGAAIGGGIDKQNSLRATYGKATTNTNPYGFELGGMIGGKEDLSYYKGRQHRHGGILVSGNGIPSYNPVAEVEGGETRWKIGNKAFIFSKKLKV
jgi:hypothetical protein